MGYFPIFANFYAADSLRSSMTVAGNVSTCCHRHRMFKRCLSTPPPTFRMTAINLEATRLRSLGIEVERFSHSDQELHEPSWAHVSGWAQLSGKPRKISCVLTCRDNAAWLGRMLPEVSDTLTEIGFPWELTIVDNASRDESFDLLTVWAELPGFNWMRLAKDYGEDAAVRAGLCSARGDAVILIRAPDDPPLKRLSELVDRWEQGHEIVVLEQGAGNVCSPVEDWSQDRFDMNQFLATDPNRVKQITRHLILLDRGVVESIIGSPLRSMSRPAT